MNMTSGVFAASLLCSTLRASLLYSLWNALMPCRLRKALTYAIILITFITLDLTTLILSFYGISPYFLFIIYCLLLFLIVFFLYRGAPLARTIHIFLGLSLYAIAGPITSGLFNLLPDRLQHILNYPTELEKVISIDFLGYTFTMIGQFLFVALITHLIMELYKRIRFKDSFPSQAKFMLIPASQFLLLMTYIIFSFSNNMVVPQIDTYIVVILFIAVLICIVANVFLFLALKDMDKKMELELQLRLLKQSQLSDYEQYKVVDNLYRREREFRHDINNKLITAQSLLNQGANQELSNFLQELSGAVSRHRYAEYCENSLINTVLNNKIDTANSLGIQVETDACVGKLPLPGTDLCSLFSNILDNAVDACRALPPEHEKCIYLAVRVQNNYLIVTCKNPALHGPSSEIRIGTDGKGTDRGWGLGILSRMAQQYSGNLHTEFTEGYFLLQIALKLNQDPNS